MIISIASGKGGTGKTTIATNLAVSIADEEERIQFLDCDVEAPNAHLFLKPDIYETEKVGTLVPTVNLDRCDFCGKCDEICQFSAIAVVGKTVLTFPELCHSCKGCMMVCPREAITESTRELGVLEKGKAGNIEFVSGSLRIGEAMSPPLINEVKKTIRKVNALEKIAIPDLKDTVYYIQSRLEENERDMFVLMKMVKANLERKRQKTKGDGS